MCPTNPAQCIQHHDSVHTPGLNATSRTRLKQGAVSINQDLELELYIYLLCDRIAIHIHIYILVNIIMTSEQVRMTTGTRIDPLDIYVYAVVQRVYMIQTKHRHKKHTELAAP